MIWLQYAIETGSEEARKLRDLWECGNDEPPAPQVTLEPVQVQEPRAWNRWVDRLPRWMISAPLGLLLLISTLGALAFFLGTATALLLFSWTISELGTTFFAVQLVMILLTFGIAIWWLRSPQMRFKRKVRRLFTRAQAGHPEAQRELALAYLEGSHGLPKDSSQALWWMRRCAENGAAHDAYILAQWMDQGIGQFRNRREAMVWLQHAANEGYGPAKVLIARWSSGIDT
jgi:hypothetical protein